MIKTATFPKIVNIFGAEETIKYSIPKYQREYVWWKDNWENLYNDILEADNGHFIGSIICVNKGLDSNNLTTLEIIDGQQRLTTLSIFYLAAYKKLKELSKTEQDLSDDVKASISFLKYRLVVKKKQDEVKLELSEQKNNKDDYKSILSELAIIPNQIKRLNNFGNRRISKTYNFFCEKLENKSISQIFEIIDKFDVATLVKIEVESHSDAFILFETINNRGIPLSAIDLIKNNILASFEDIWQKENKKGKLNEQLTIKNIDTAFSEWQILVENLPDYIYQERFLRQFYNAFKYKPEFKIQGITRATKTNLIKIYEELIKRDVNLIFTHLLEKSKLYNNFIEPTEDKLTISLYSSLIDLIHISAVPVNTFLLYLFTEYSDNLFKEQILKFLEKYFVRRNITDFPATRDLDKIFMDLIDLFEDKKQNIQISDLETFLTNEKRFASLSVFKSKLNGSIYEENTDMTRFLLSKLEEKHFNTEYKKDLWERDKNGKLIWSIEHIFPEGENIPYHWIEMIANGDVNLAKQHLNEFVHKFGNLTLTGYNSKLFNFDFITKRDKKDTNNNFIGYKNNLKINSYIVENERDKWTIENIKERTNILINEIICMYKLDNENA